MQTDRNISVSLSKVTKAYSQGRERITAARDISLEIEKGRLTMLMGPSGSGKTTLLRLVGGVERPDSGEIHIDRTRIDGMSESELTMFRRANLGFVFQENNLINELTVRDNVEMPLVLCNHSRQDRNRRVASLLDRMGMAKHAKAHPNSLSGGEQQRVAIARAIAHGPALLIADEPTASLDHKLGEEIAAILHSLCEIDNITVLLASHDRRLLETAHRVVKIEDGTIVA